ncbi:MAG: SDR family oxidoreductase [Ruminococcaceae bacterium]|nr:SDR family oxidoreductase [Oscillospiraceae bacterium]
MDYTFRLSGKNVVVTGAAGGIGLEITKGLLQNGADVYMVDYNGEALEKSASELKNEYKENNIYTVTADITKKEDVENLIKVIAETTNSVDVLINNAGVGCNVFSVKETLENWSRVVDINLTSQFFLSQAIAGYFMIPEKKGGKIINMASLGGIMGIPNAVAYSASKGGVMQMTKSLAAEWARFNITVNCVCPGFVETPLIAENLANEKWVGYMNLRNPMHRLAKPEDIVGPTLFLASEYSNYVNGTSVVVDGGYSCSG